MISWHACYVINCCGNVLAAAHGDMENAIYYSMWLILQIARLEPTRINDIEFILDSFKEYMPWKLELREKMLCALILHFEGAPCDHMFALGLIDDLETIYKNPKLLKEKLNVQFSW
jgi:hypothetical protein